ncbi:MAG: hypothetical protein RR645_04830 [Clostridium sp.]
MNIKLRYVGEDIFLSLVNGRVYECVDIEDDLIRVIDEEGEDYLYAILRPRPLDGSSEGGIWEVVEDNEDKLFEKTLDKYIELAKSKNYDYLFERKRIIEEYIN